LTTAFSLHPSRVERNIDKEDKNFRGIYSSHIIHFDICILDNLLSEEEKTYKEDETMESEREIKIPFLINHNLGLYGVGVRV
jgi:hypothetical protein